MELERRLARALVRDHPERAAAVLERLDPSAAARLLEARSGEERGAEAELLRRMVPAHAAGVLRALGSERGAQGLAALDLDVAAHLLRRLEALEAGASEALLAHAAPARARALRALLRFPAHTAGALMDPEVLALPVDATAAEALARVRAAADRARYTLYVLDREQLLVGALTLRELLLAPPRTPLAEIMTRDPLRLDARDDRARVVTHPGWREVHALPVVDERGAYLGAVRYRTMRVLEEELLHARAEDEDASRALGRLFATAAGGVLDALTGAPAAPGRGARDGA
jgi:Mg/Co/Ni transporter MgtE